MNNKNAYSVFEALESRGQLHSKGKGWETRCPVPDHEDRKPSFFLYPRGGGKCYTQCGRYWSAYELADLLEIKLPAQGVGISTAELATAKGLSEDFLQRHGVSDGFNGSGKQRPPALMFNIPIKVERLLPYGSVSTLTAPFVLNGEEAITHHYMACRI